MTATATMTNTAILASLSVSKAAGPINYAPFRHAIRKYINGKITREGFFCEWEIGQKEQGIRATRLKVI